VLSFILLKTNCCNLKESFSVKQVAADLKISSLNNRDEALTTLTGYGLNNLGMFRLFFIPFKKIQNLSQKGQSFMIPTTGLFSS